MSLMLEGGTGDSSYSRCWHTMRSVDAVAVVVVAASTESVVAVVEVVVVEWTNVCWVCFAAILDES